MRNKWLVISGLWLVTAMLAISFSGCSTSDVEERGTKVLVIGNSFSICLLQNLPQVAAAAGVDLDFASLYIGGCSLKRHWENVERDGDKDFKPYTFGRNRFGKVSQGRANICDVLRMAKWDVVTIQQVSHESWKPETFEPYGGGLVAKIRELAPQAKIYVHETWSYTPWDKRFAKWGIGQTDMYDKLHATYRGFAGRYGLGVIPFGTAVQEWRRRLPVKYTENSLGGDVVGGRWQDPKDMFRRDEQRAWIPNCDVCHLNRKGEYFQAVVWFATLFQGVDITDLSYRPDGVSETDFRLMRDIATDLAGAD